MHSPLERSAGALPSCCHGLLIRWIGAVLLWAATLGVGFGHAASAWNDVANGAAPFAAATATATSPTRSIEATAAEADESPRRAVERGDRFATGSDGDGAAATVDLVEPTEEIHACDLAPGLRCGATAATTLRRRGDDSVEESRPVRVAPTRAPPVTARTVA